MTADPEAQTSGRTWNPDQYARFRDERSQPFYDLLSLIQPIEGGRAIDLGCGTGELTRVVHERTGAGATLGLDNSESMLEKSAAFAGNGVTFRLGTILRFAPRTPFALIFSNAALQWVPDHERLIPRLVAGLAEGGQLAVQIPANVDHPSHRIAHEVAGEEPFRTALDGYLRPDYVKPPEWYAEMLERLGFVEQHVRMQVYGHHLSSRDEVIQWVRGTLLTDYERRLEPAVYAAYLERYRERLMPELADTQPYFYAFKRILFWGRRR